MAKVQVRQEVASPGNFLRSAFFARYLRKAFFPKHQDLQFAGEAGVGADPHFPWITPQTPRNCCAGGRTGPGRARPVRGGKRQVCGRPEAWNSIPPCASSPLLPTGLLNPLDSPHHMRQDEESEFREGIVVDRPTRPGHGSFVNCGMKKVGIGRVG